MTFCNFSRIGVNKTPEILERNNNVNLQYFNFQLMVYHYQVSKNKISFNKEDKSSFLKLEKLHKTITISKNNLKTNKTNQFVYLTNKSKQSKQSHLLGNDNIFKNDKKSMHPKIK